jgi:predicted DNA-binding transcriptional regulator AlpA
MGEGDLNPTLTRAAAPVPVDAGRLLLKVPEVAAAMGCCPEHVWRMLSAGKFGPAVIHIGRLARVRKAEFEAWIQAECPPRSRWTWNGRRKEVVDKTASVG